MSKKCKKVYAYGLPFGPSEKSLDIVNKTYREAHEYYNECIEIHRSFNRKLRDFIKEFDSVSCLLKSYNEQVDKKKKDKIKKLLGKECKIIKEELERVKLPSKIEKLEKDLLKLQFEESKKARKELAKKKNELKELRERVKKSFYFLSTSEQRNFLVHLESVRKKDFSDLREKYGDSQYVIAHGTYNPVEKKAIEATKGPERGPFNVLGKQPKFKSANEGWRKKSTIGVQIISSEGRLYTEGLFEDDRRVSISAPNKRGHCVLSLRLSAKKGLKVNFPMVYHRPFPPEAEIKRVDIVRVRKGVFRGFKTRWEYKALFTVNIPPISKQPKHVGALDLGWSRKEVSEGLRVAYFGGTDGNSGWIELPYSFLERRYSTDFIKHYSDKCFNEIKDFIKSWIKDNKNSWVEISLSDFREDGTCKYSALQFLSSVKSIDKFNCKIRSRIYHKLSDAVVGERILKERLSEWFREDKHYRDWWINQERTLTRSREEYYRILASLLAKRYDKIIIEDLNLSDLARTRAGSSNRQIASLSTFKRCLENAGIELEEVNKNGTSRECFLCGGRMSWGKKNYDYPKCSQCGMVNDRDNNAWPNILFRSKDPRVQVLARADVATQRTRPLDLCEIAENYAPKRLTHVSLKFAEFVKK